MTAVDAQCNSGSRLCFAADSRETGNGRPLQREENVSGVLENGGQTALSTRKSKALRAESQTACFVCGPDHPHGLRIRYERAADGSVAADWVPSSGWEGFRGIVHGGILGTVLDEAMSKAVASRGCEALTAELRVRFRHYVVPGERLAIRGWVVDQTGRLTRAEATLQAANGDERAHAWAKFLLVSKRAAGKPPAGR